MSGRHSFTVLNYRCVNTTAAVTTAAVRILNDDPNRFGAVIWGAGDNTSHIVISTDSGVGVGHTWTKDEEIATWNNPVIVPWWDKRQRWAITRDADQEVHIREYTNEEAVPR